MVKKIPSKKKVTGKKTKFNLSSTQKKIALGGSITLIALGGFFAWSTYQNNQLSASSCVNKTLRQGSKGTCVKYAQILLNSHSNRWENLRYAKVSEDSAFGPKTTTAAKAFQKYKKLKSDGIIGKKTWDQLCSPGGMGSSSVSKTWSVTFGSPAVDKVAKSAGCVLSGRVK